MTRRGFLGALLATSALVTVGGVAQAQALPVTVTPAVSTTGRMVVSSITLNGSTTALSIGDRVILSRAATQVAAKAATRAIANRTMGLIATRALASAATLGPWGLAAAGLGVVAYGAYRYFTAPGEAGTSTGVSYQVQYDQQGAAQIRAALANNTCAGLPANSGSYPDTVIIGAFNGSSGCLPQLRVKVVVQCTAAQLAGAVPTPSGWNRAHSADKGYVDQANGIKEFWVFFTKSFTATGGVYAPETYPSAIPATVPAALPADVRVQQPAPTSVADLANGLWQQAVPSNDPAALPWTSPNAATATETLPTIAPGAQTVADPAPGTIGDLTTPRPAVVPSGSTVTWTYPDSVRFPDDAPGTDPTPDPDPDPDPDPTPGGNPSDEAAEPDAVADLPGFESFAGPFRNLFKPLTDALTPAPASCPPLVTPAVTVWNGQGLASQSFTYHCQVLAPFEGIIKAVGTAWGGWVGLKRAMEA